MIQITDTLTISATRLLDLAREVTLQLGEWQYHKHLRVAVSCSQLGRPAVFFTLTHDADRTTRLDFIDAFAVAMDERVHTTPSHYDGSWVVSVGYQDVSGVHVGASVTITGAEVVL